MAAFRANGLVTLTTDFGLREPFVGIMKGVILSLAPSAQVVDITHDIESHDIQEAAFVIDSAFRYIPAGTVHAVVVDPGVGSARRPIAALAGGHVFVAPDNGVLSFVLQSEPPRPVTSAYHITNEDLWHHPVSRTFHGRDIFASVAAHLARGVPLDSVGPCIYDFMTKPLVKPRSNGNQNLRRFLTIADGVVRSQGRKIIFSTNLPNVGDLDEALIRPGRCFGRLNVRVLTAEEAAKVAVKAAAGDPVKLEKARKAFAESSQRSYSLAKVFEMVK